MIVAGKRIKQAGLIALTVILCLFFLSLPCGANDKRLEVTKEKASIRLDPKENSPLVASLVQGSILTLATEVKFCREWLYVRFESPESGRIRSGYVREQEVRRLVPKVRMIHIAAEGEVMNPTDLDFNPSYLPSVEWGSAREKIIRVEGRPYKTEPIKKGEILQYRRNIVNKRCLVEYVFAENRLVSTRFYLLERYVDRNLYIREYNQIKNFLNDKIGVPRADRTVWQDDSVEFERSLWGQALVDGNLEFSAEWVFRDTSLHLILAGTKSQVVFGAEIYDVKFLNPASF